MTYKTCFSPNNNDTVYILHTLSTYITIYISTGHPTNTCIPSMNCIMLSPHTYTHTHYSAYKKYSKACSTYTTSYIAYTAIIRHGANTQYNTKHYNAKQNSTVQNKNNKLFTHTKNIYIDTSATCMMLDKVALPCLILRCLCYITCIGASPCIYFLLCLVISKVNIYIYNEWICANMCVINHVAACVTYGDICMKRTSSTQ